MDLFKALSIGITTFGVMFVIRTFIRFAKLEMRVWALEQQLAAAQTDERASRRARRET